jgi:hypothetical protein
MHSLLDGALASDESASSLEFATPCDGASGQAGLAGCIHTRACVRHPAQLTQRSGERHSHLASPRHHHAPVVGRFTPPIQPPPGGDCHNSPTHRRSRLHHPTPPLIAVFPPRRSSPSVEFSLTPGVSAARAVRWQPRSSLLHLFASLPAPSRVCPSGCARSASALAASASTPRLSSSPANTPLVRSLPGSALSACTRSRCGRVRPHPTVRPTTRTPPGVHRTAPSACRRATTRTPRGVHPIASPAPGQQLTVYMPSGLYPGRPVSPSRTRPRALPTLWGPRGRVQSSRSFCPTICAHLPTAAPATAVHQPIAPGTPVHTSRRPAGSPRVRPATNFTNVPPPTRSLTASGAGNRARAQARVATPATPSQQCIPRTTTREGGQALSPRTPAYQHRSFTPRPTPYLTTRSKETT